MPPKMVPWQGWGVLQRFPDDFFTFRRINCATTIVSLLGLLSTAVVIAIFQTLNSISLPPLSTPDVATWRADPEWNAICDGVCRISYFGLGIHELAGLTLLPYEVKVPRNDGDFEDFKGDRFDVAMAHLFGPEWSVRFPNVTCHVVRGSPVLRFQDAFGRNVVAMLSFASAQEFGLQLQVAAVELVLPFLSDIAPFSDVGASRTPWFTEAALAGGQLWLDPTAPPDLYVSGLRKWLDAEEMSAEDTVIAGIGTGALIAKQVGLMRGYRAFGFFGFAATGSYQVATLAESIDRMYSPLITTVYNWDGVYAKPEPDFGDNYGIPWIAINSSVVREESILGRDSRYRSFCTLSAYCYKASNFNDFCVEALGNGTFRQILAAMAPLANGDFTDPKVLGLLKQQDAERKRRAGERLRPGGDE
jgi:hypothetical protein